MRVLIATGASGGHIFPALSFLDELRQVQPGSETLLVLPQRGVALQVVPEQISARFISVLRSGAKGNRRYPDIFLNLLYGTYQSFRILLRFKPDVVVGFGTIDCVGLVLLAWFFRISTLLHEQNVVPGKANRLLAKFVDRVAVSFPQTVGYLDINPERITVTGNPVRRQLQPVERQEALRFFGLEEGAPIILVMGGSQGSRSINRFFCEAITRLPEGCGFGVIHLGGQADCSFLEDAYRKAGLKARVFGFLDKMHYAYSICDLAVCRAGAMTVAELIHFKIPAVLIPYPFAHRHQMENARFLEKMGAAVIIRDDELSPDILRRTFLNVTDKTGMLQRMRSAYAQVSVSDSAKLLVEQAIALLQ